MVIIGHRGATEYEPENTLASFAKALEIGVDGIELDVHICKTGEVVVIHDSRLKRTTNGSGYVKDKTLEELKGLDAGKGQRIPTFKEVLDLIDKRAIVDIELKAEHTSGPVADILQEYIKGHGWKEDHFLISSFDHHELRRFHMAMPKVPFAPLIAAKPLDYALFAQNMNATAVNPLFDFIDGEFVQDAHKRGLKMFVWTVDHPDDIKEMIKIAVDGFITNRPERVRTIVDSLS
jgi:glycerophosphoryl diester phosphodiesterase